MRYTVSMFDGRLMWIGSGHCYDSHSFNPCVQGGYFFEGLIWQLARSIICAGSPLGQDGAKSHSHRLADFDFGSPSLGARLTTRGLFEGLDLQIQKPRSAPWSREWTSDDGT